MRWPDVGRVVLAAVPGLAGGALLLCVVPKPVLQGVVGAGVLLAVLLQLRRGEPRAATAVVHRPSWGSVAGIGVFRAGHQPLAWPGHDLAILVLVAVWFGLSRLFIAALRTPKKADETPEVVAS